MLTISEQDIQKTGGFLAALSDKSCEYVRSIFNVQDFPALGGKESSLERIIVHTDPHVDEYFAQLIFRACLPPDRRGCEFLEQSIFSTDNDLDCQQLWPSAAVFGIGAATSGGVSALYLFDEHVASPGRPKIAPSCSHLVANKMLRVIPNSIATVLKEIDVIDDCGNAHPQNLWNLIKLLHEIRFVFKMDANSSRLVNDSLSTEWKKALFDASLTAVLYCLENQIDIISNPLEAKASIEKSLKNYSQNSPHIAHVRFQDALQQIRSTYGNQEIIFKDAVLQDRTGPIKDSSGNYIPQLLLLARVCIACEKCWGEKISNVITTHFWEVEMQKQLNFYLVKDAVAELFTKNVDRLVCPAGFLRKQILPSIDLGKGQQAQVWIVSISPEVSVFRPNQGISNYINKKNAGCGLILIQDTVRGTNALSMCSGVPQSKWKLLVDLIVSKEPDYWHVTTQASGDIAPFILNGNKAHLYKPRSGLDVNILADLVRKTFYKRP